ncbi:GTP-binding protein [Mycobacterium sp. Y57]|uniref:CobW family GTP-binding protein n=1 Tax=Mycolicibacterium xanthum TaxID=2796469 RepID=UPI001C8624BE|nr:GTP-binding protein [Mycolicibacterium xanthum]MBX7433682.1 GTP-binding protein [Mycolicibacterium xanthum]
MTPDAKTPQQGGLAADPYTTAQEAQQALSGMVFAALKNRGRKIRAPERSLPLTIIGGFLGSGKTTLLNHLLTEPHGRRLVVLVNDFGRINIDAALVASQTDDMITLTNGCACCAVSADLTNTLIELAERDVAPETIVLEASGIADPTGIAQTALTNQAVHLDGILVAIDAETLHERAENPLTSRLFGNQIAAADLIVLTKVDLIDEAQQALTWEWLATHHPDKSVVEAIGGDIPPEVVLRVNTTRGMQTAAGDPEDHARAFESVSVTIDDPLERDHLHAFFNSLPKALLRAKGVLHLVDTTTHRTIYQRVGARWSCTPGQPWEDERPRSSLVFIGPPGLLDPTTTRVRLEACVAGRNAAMDSA